MAALLAPATAKVSRCPSEGRPRESSPPPNILRTSLPPRAAIGGRCLRRIPRHERDRRPLFDRGRRPGLPSKQRVGGSSPPGGILKAASEAEPRPLKPSTALLHQRRGSVVEALGAGAPDCASVKPWPWRRVTSTESLARRNGSLGVAPDRPVASHPRLLARRSVALCSRGSDAGRPWSAACSREASPAGHR